MSTRFLFHIHMPDNAKNRETYGADKSKGTSTPAECNVTRAVLDHLASGPKQAGEIEESVMSTAGVSKSFYYKILGRMRDRRDVSYVNAGRQRWYSLPKDASQLSRYSARKSRLELYVIENAHILIDDIMKCNHEDYIGHKDEYTIAHRCVMLHDVVLKLKPIHPRIPLITDKVYKKYGPLASDPGVNIRPWHRYWMDILEYFKEY